MYFPPKTNDDLNSISFYNSIHIIYSIFIIYITVLQLSLHHIKKYHTSKITRRHSLPRCPVKSEALNSSAAHSEFLRFGPPPGGFVGKKREWLKGSEGPNGQRLRKESTSRWWFEIFFIFTPTWGRWTHFGSYFSSGLKPPTRNCWKVDSLPWTADIERCFQCENVFCYVYSYYLQRILGWFWFLSFQVFTRWWFQVVFISTPKIMWRRFEPIWTLANIFSKWGWFDSTTN